MELPLEIHRDHTTSMEQVSSKLNSFINNGLFADFKIITSDGSVQCHAVVVAASSEFVETWKTFDSNRNRSELRLEQFSTEIIQQIINFIYTGTLLTTSAQLEYILHAADYLAIRDLRQLVLVAAADTLTATNVVRWLACSKEFESDYLWAKAMNFLAEEMGSSSNLSVPNGFSEMDVTELIECITCWREAAVGRLAIFTWLNSVSDPTTRIRDAALLLEAIEAGDCSKESLCHSFPSQEEQSLTQIALTESSDIAQPNIHQTEGEYQLINTTQPPPSSASSQRFYIQIAKAACLAQSKPLPFPVTRVASHSPHSTQLHSTPLRKGGRSGRQRHATPVVSFRDGENSTTLCSVENSWPSQPHTQTPAHPSHPPASSPQSQSPHSRTPTSQISERLVMPSRYSMGVPHRTGFVLWCVDEPKTPIAAVFESPLHPPPLSPHSLVPSPPSFTLFHVTDRPWYGVVLAIGYMNRSFYVMGTRDENAGTTASKTDVVWYRYALDESKWYDVERRGRPYRGSKLASVSLVATTTTIPSTSLTAYRGRVPPGDSLFIACHATNMIHRVSEVGPCPSADGAVKCEDVTVLPFGGHTLINSPATPSVARNSLIAACVSNGSERGGENEGAVSVGGIGAGNLYLSTFVYMINGDGQFAVFNCDTKRWILKQKFLPVSENKIMCYEDRLLWALTCRQADGTPIMQYVRASDGHLVFMEYVSGEDGWRECGLEGTGGSPVSSVDLRSSCECTQLSTRPHFLCWEHGE
eukprot:GHVN01043773.1.p1 GENE.GHVN01043773.1~~GHVN01043773.1.p1  ORF type:complete len:755 (+),score=142.50 GHVN01043773.1:200-2464(+)